MEFNNIQNNIQFLVKTENNNKLIRFLLHLTKINKKSLLNAQVRYTIYMK